MKCLIVWGAGGCWSGYPHAEVIDEESVDAAKDVAAQRAIEYTHGAYGVGASFDAAEVVTTVEECPLFSRVLCGIIQGEP